MVVEVKIFTKTCENLQKLYFELTVFLYKYEIL